MNVHDSAGKVRLFLFALKTKLDILYSLCVRAPCVVLTDPCSNFSLVQEL